MNNVMENLTGSVVLTGAEYQNVLDTLRFIGTYKQQPLDGEAEIFQLTNDLNIRIKAAREALQRLGADI